jgi:uncharacterized protein
VTDVTDEIDGIDEINGINGINGIDGLDAGGDDRLSDDEKLETSDETLEAPERTATGRSRPPGTRRRRRGFGQRWSRILHVYLSMISFVVVLFFAVTGVTLNHPTWSIGTSSSKSTVKGTLPAATVTGATVDWLAVSEYLRKTHDVRGSVTDKRLDGTDATLSYLGPGYQADAFFSTTDRVYELDVERQGIVGVINDLHKGRDTKASWKWLIDVSGILLALVSLTGLTLQFFIRKRKVSALTSALVGGLLLGVLVWIAVS